MKTSAQDLLEAANKASLSTKKKTKTERVGLYGVTEEMRDFIEEDQDDKVSSYIMRALKKQLREDGFKR
jgi:hypothetical protein